MIRVALVSQLHDWLARAADEGGNGVHSMDLGGGAVTFGIDAQDACGSVAFLACLECF